MRTPLLSVVCVLLFGGQALAQDKTILEMPDLGLAMSHPVDWQITKVAKSNDVRILIPIEGSSQKAVLELYSIAYNAERDVWQLGQKAINERMKREVMRQWEEELLSVPMLLTKVNYVEKVEPQILLTGLIYSRTDKKLMFRLTAAPDDFDKAEFVWRQTMNTFRTGREWTPEDPNRRPDPNAPIKTSLPVPAISKPNSLDGDAKVVKPPVSIETEVAGRKVLVRVPGEWAGKVQEDGTIHVTHPEIAGPIRLTLASTLDSDPPQRALLAASSKTLADYQKVAKRDESAPAKNKAGATVATVWRSGTTAQGDLYTCDSVIQSGDFYYLLAFRSTSASKIGAERKLMETLIQNSTIEVVP